MERKYKAFISYRRLPLDTSIAKRLLRRIEHYVIPKDLRKNGEKRLGYVFRDQDELQASSDLPTNIRSALDNSEFLIVICTPDAKKSPWVQEEIRCFLEHHDHDHILAVLASGSPKDSFPAGLTDVFDENGTVYKRYDPLAANVVSDSVIKRNRLFRTESLRILAALIGYSFDELYRREQRYKMQRIGVAVGVFAMITAAFIGVLLNRNAEITRQMLNAKINESKALVGSSSNYFENGNYRGALNAALDALPGRDSQRPFIPAAEAVLADELYLYRTGIYRYVQSIEQESSIDGLYCDNELNTLVTLDVVQELRAYDTVTGKLLWEYRIEGESPIIEMLERKHLLLISTVDRIFALDLHDGTCIWEQNEYMMNAISESQDYGLFHRMYSDEFGWNNEFLLIDLDSGDVVNSIQFNHYLDVETLALSQDNRYAAALIEIELGDTLSLIVFDFQTGEYEILSEEFSFSFPSVHYRMCFNPENDLVLVAGMSFALEADGEYSYICCFDRKQNWAVRYKTEFEISSRATTVNNGYLYFPSVDFFDCRSNVVAVGTKNILLMLDMSNGEVLWKNQLPGLICAANMYDHGVIGLALSNGLITFCTFNGAMSHEAYLYYFETDYNLYTAAISGKQASESVFAVVPAENHTCVAILRYWQDDELTSIVSNEDLLGQSNLFSSPSGKWLAYVKSLDDGGISGVMIDSKNGYKKYPFQVADVKWYYQDFNEVFITEKGLIVAKDLIIDPWKQSWSGISESEEISYFGSTDISDTSYHDNTVITASLKKSVSGKYGLLLWRDGMLVDKIPLPEEHSGESWDYVTYSCTDIGGNAYVVVSKSINFSKANPYYIYSVQERKWHRFEEFCNASILSLALADKQEWLALIGDNDVLYVYDLEKGEQLFSIDCEITASNIVKLTYFCDDHILAVFSSDGKIILYDANHGHTLFSLFYGNEMPVYFDDARFSCYPVKQQDRILLVYDDPYYSVPIGFLVNTEQWELEGVYHGVAAYLPELNCLIIDTYRDGIFYTKLLTRDEIMEKAEKLLEEGVVLK